MMEEDKRHSEAKYELRDKAKAKIDEIFELVDASKTRELEITCQVSAGHVVVDYEIKGTL